MSLPGRDPPDDGGRVHLRQGLHGIRQRGRNQGMQRVPIRRWGNHTSIYNSTSYEYEYYFSELGLMQHNATVLHLIYLFGKNSLFLPLIVAESVTISE